MLPEVPNVWDRYPGELPGDYALFLRYLEQGVARSVANTQRLAQQGEASGYTYSYVLNLAKAWLWKERAEAWDASVLEQRKEAFVKLEAEKVGRWGHDQLELAELTTQLLRDELIALRQAQLDGKRLPVTAMAQLMDRLHKWMQLATGGKTDDVGVAFDITRADPATKALLQSPEVREALEQISKG